MLHAADKLGQEDQQRQEKASRGGRERSVGAARAPLYYMLHLRKVIDFNFAGDLDTYTISHDTRKYMQRNAPKHSKAKHSKRWTCNAASKVLM